MSQSISTRAQTLRSRGLEAWSSPRTRVRLAIAVITAAVFLGAAAYAAGKRSIEDAIAEFIWAPVHIVPEGHRAQVAVVRSLIPPGSWVVYVDDRPEAWQSGLWQRSLYPDYVVYRVAGDEQLNMILERARRRGHAIRYAIATTRYTPKRPFARTTPLPDYPTGIPLRFGTWSE